MSGPLELDYPFRGRWQVRNSPANRVPSHGTPRFGLSYAIDFVPVDDAGRSAPFKLGSLFRSEPPEAFVGFGRPVLSPIAGLVIGVHNAEIDHAAYRGFPSVGYAASQRRRATVGRHALLGNHVLIEATRLTGFAVVVLCHLQHGSVEVTLGQHVVSGQPIGRCGNSGNSTEPHLHLHAVDGRDITRARAVPIQFNRSIPRNGTVVDVS
ncbi:M23 family metallopeptidase [Enteractinococcus fodinae]|uniref:M23 family metallopeptidase n=1 Tax=Enteractinococcus fodinae TaxID=684663 RepID=UPI00286C3B4A|nr:M23 family metallopeptidase [Enteractinococcus fodinae]